MSLIPSLVYLSLQHVRKMDFQAFENNGSNSKDNDCEHPKVYRGEEVLEEPFLLIDCTPIAVDDINQRIDFYQCPPSLWQEVNIPQNGRRPHADLK